MFPREIHVLLCGARTEMDPDHGAWFHRLVGRDIDWDRLMDLAGWHGMLPLLHHHLRPLGADAVPSPFRRELQASYQANAGRARFLEGELRRLLSRFADHGIRGIPYKGVALAHRLYGDVALREAGDLDIIVRRGDVPRAASVVGDEGYRPSPPLTPREKRILHATGHHYTYEHPSHHTWLEIHWAVALAQSRFHNDMEELWSRLVCASFGGISVPAFRPEDLLLALSDHGAKHVWGRIKWLCDIGQLVRAHRSMDWDEAIATASHRGQRRMVLVALCLAERLLGTRLPDAVRSAVHCEPGIESACRVACRHISDPRDLGLQPSWRSLAFPCMVRERLRDRIAYGMSTAERLLRRFPNTVRKISAVAKQSLPPLRFGSFEKKLP